MLGLKFKGAHGPRPTIDRQGEILGTCPWWSDLREARVAGVVRRALPLRPRRIEAHLRLPWPTFSPTRSAASVSILAMSRTRHGNRLPLGRSGAWWRGFQPRNGSRQND